MSACEEKDSDVECWLRETEDFLVASSIDLFKTICYWVEFDLRHRKRAVSGLSASWLYLGFGTSPEDVSEISRKRSSCQSRILMFFHAYSLIALLEVSGDLIEPEFSIVRHHSTNYC